MWSKLLKNLEIVKVKVENLRELFKFILIIELSIITGVITLSYWLLIKKVPFYFLIFDFIGFFIFMFLVIVLKFIWKSMDNLIKEIENE